MPSEKLNIEKTDDELKQIAKDAWAGKIFTSNSIPEHDVHLIPSIFMPLMFMEDHESLKDAAYIYAYLDKAGQRCINGYPIFMEFEIMTKDNASKVLEYYNKIKEAMEGI